MRKTIIFLILLVFSPSVHAGPVYRWVDRSGTVNFTDDRNAIPPSYRGRVETKMSEDLTTAEVPAQGVASPKGAAMKTDLYGRDETWWREKVRPWEEQREEAIANYERVWESLTEKAEELVRRRYGSKMQYQMISYVLDGLRDRLDEYEARIAEADRMVEKLSREAEEAKADPAWLEQRTPSQAIDASDKEEIKADLYGHGEAWWREKVRPWKEELKETEGNHKRVRKEFVRQAERLRPSRFGGLSLTQYQMTSSREVSLDDQMSNYEARIAEADRMLKKLSKEAEEAKASPEWLQ
jgi:hypothetical protein